jgi:hypothetical protein
MAQEVPMNYAERQSKIAVYGKAHELLVGALKQCPKEMWP